MATAAVFWTVYANLIGSRVTDKKLIIIMINIIPIQQAYTNIFNRQKQVPSLKRTPDGICSYIGDLSPSITHYLTNDNFIKHITFQQ